jgi:predicted DNA-binding transcriptional regulator AlpA
MVPTTKHARIRHEERPWTPHLGRDAKFHAMAKRPRKRSPEVDPDQLLTSPAAAELAGLDRTHFARLVRQGRGPKHQRVGRFVMVRRGDLAPWIAARNR